MARRLRVDVPGVPQHVIQRGVDRSVCFCDDLDRQFYLAVLESVAAEHGCAVHAYILMTNHTHLLITGEETGSVSRTMQCLGRRYVRRFNDRHRRTGTLWGRSCAPAKPAYTTSMWLKGGSSRAWLAPRSTCLPAIAISR